MNYLKNIVIVLLSQKFGGGAVPIGAKGGGLLPPGPMVATALYVTHTHTNFLIRLDNKKKVLKIKITYFINIIDKNFKAF